MLKGILSRIRGLLGGSRDIAKLDKWMDYDVYGAPTASGAHVTPETALRVAAVYSCIRVIAETIGSLPFHVFRRLDRGRERAFEHPLYFLLSEEPNPWMTKMEFFEVVTAHLNLRGNHYSYIVSEDQATIDYLLPLNPARVEVQWRSGKVVYIFTDDQGRKMLLMPREIFHVKGLSTDGIKGRSPIEVAREVVGLGIVTQEMAARLYSNDARPGGVIEHPGELGDEGMKNLMESWKAAHTGVAKAHKPAILEEGAKWHQVGMTSEDAQFLESRRFQVEEIARVFRVPPHLVGDLSKATYSNIEQQNIDFVQKTILPWASRIESAVKRCLFSPDDKLTYYPKFNLDGILRGDIETRFKAYGAGRQWGIFSTNDIRELEEMNPVEHGDDDFLVPINMALAKDLGKDNGDGGSQDEENPFNEQFALRSGAGRVKIQQAHQRLFLDGARRIVRRDVIRVGKLAKKFLERDVSDFLNAASDYFEESEGFYVRTFKPTVAALAESIAGAIAEEMDSDEVDAASRDKFVKAYLESMAARHTKSSVGQLRDVIKKAAEEGNHLEAVDERLEQWEESRPEKIARREVARASNGIAKFALVAAGATALRWATTGGDNCPACEDLDGVVIGVNDSFAKKGDTVQAGDQPAIVPRFDIGHPPIHDGCDCIIISA